MKKKVLSLALAGALALSSSSMAFATEVSTPDATTGEYKADVSVDTETNVPTIKVTIPTALTIGINPYQLEYEIDGAKYTDVLANVEQTIKNESDVPISVSAVASAAAASGSEVVLATTALKGTETTKSVFAFLEIKEKDAEDGEAEFSKTYDTKAVNQLVFSTKETTKKDMVTLPAGKDAATFAGFKIFGSAAAKPAKAWAATDTLDMKLTFKLDPVVVPAATTP